MLNSLPKSTHLLSYTIATFAVAIALLLMLLMNQFIDVAANPFLLFFVTIIVSTFLGSFSSGIFATALSALVIAYWFLPPINSFDMSWGEAPQFSLFLLEGVFLNWLISSFISTKQSQRAIAQADELEKHSLPQNNNLLEVVIEGTTDAIFVKDIHGRYLMINSAGANYIGKPVKEIVGKKDIELFTQETASRILENDQRIFRNKQSETYEEIIKTDKTTHTYLTKKAPFYNPQGHIIGVVGVSQNISTTKQLEQELRARCRQQEAIAQLGQIALSGVDLDALMKETATVITQTLEVEYCKILELLPEGKAFFLRGGVGWESGLVGRATVGTELASQSGYTLLSQHPIIVEDLRTETRFNGTGLLHNHGVVSGMSVIVTGQNQPWGVLGAHTTQHRKFTQDDINFFQAAANLLAEAIARKQVEVEKTELLASEQAARATAEAANRMKDEFLAIVSHELRSPLNAIMGWAQMLRSRNLPETMLPKALETIERNARLQVQLIEDLLDVSRIIRGKLRLNLYPIKLISLIEAALDTARPGAEAKEIRLLSILDATVGKVLGDSERLQQVVWNLLSNAIKFTPEGGQVEVMLQSVNSHVEIVVSDTGIGIKPEFLPFVFERFRQADGTSTRSYSGLGLGLAIVRHLVELHGGTVHVASLGEEKGTTFTVKLPLCKQEGGMMYDDASDSLNEGIYASSLVSHDSLQGLQVLVLDDEADAREFFATVLEEWGAQVKATASVREALEMITSWKPDILVSDIGMPEEDGYSFIRKVRSLPPEQGGKIPAIALTAYARSEDRQRALSEGFHNHLAKPVEPAKLAAAVAKLAQVNCDLS